MPLIVLRFAPTNAHLAPLCSPSVLRRLQEHRPLVGGRAPPTPERHALRRQRGRVDHMYHSIRRGARQDTHLFLTDNAVGRSEEDTSTPLPPTSPAAPAERRNRFSPASTRSSTSSCIAPGRLDGFEALTVVGGRLRRHRSRRASRLRATPHHTALGSPSQPRRMADPHREPSGRWTSSWIPHSKGDYYLTEIVSHHHVDRIEWFLAEARGADALSRRVRGLPLPECQSTYPGPVRGLFSGAGGRGYAGI